jgi:tetratricopeptide (TPR) repeat protein
MMLLAVAVMGPADDAKQKEADALIQLSQQYVEEGDRAEAAKLLNEAYEVVPDPQTLLLLAGVYESMDDIEGLELAIDAYKLCLTAEIDDDMKLIVEQRLKAVTRSLDDARSKKAARGAEQDAADKQRAEEGPGFMYGSWPWVILGAGVTGLTATAVFGALAFGEHEGAVDEPTQQDADSRQSLAETLAVASNISLVFGVLFTSAGATLLSLAWAIPPDENASADKRTSVAVDVTPGTVWLRVGF